MKPRRFTWEEVERLRRRRARGARLIDLAKEAGTSTGALSDILRGTTRYVWPLVRCVVCRHEWPPRRQRPLYCPACGSTRWDGRPPPALAWATSLLCETCGERFCSVAAFEAHRRVRDKRCLSAAELLNGGFAKTTKGPWRLRFCLQCRRRLLQPLPAQMRGPFLPVNVHTDCLPSYLRLTPWRRTTRGLEYRRKHHRSWYSRHRDAVLARRRTGRCRDCGAAVLPTSARCRACFLRWRVGAA